MGPRNGGTTSSKFKKEVLSEFDSRRCCTPKDKVLWIQVVNVLLRPSKGLNHYEDTEDLLKLVTNLYVNREPTFLPEDSGPQTSFYNQGSPNQGN